MPQQLHTNHPTHTVPPMREHIIIDGSNLYIEGMRLSSLRQQPPSQFPRPTYEHQEFDENYRLNLRRLRQFLTRSLPVSDLVWFGSHSENSWNVFECAAAEGYETVLFDRDTNNREKQVDSSVVTRAMTVAWDGTPQRDRITLVAGDRDYVPMVKALKSRGYCVEVVFWSHAARELRDAATAFCDLDPYLELLRYTPRTARSSHVA